MTQVSALADEQMRDRARTRARILSATEALLSAHSARDLKVRDIAARAGVSASLVVQYFLSKDALVLDVGLRRLAEFEAPEAGADAASAVAAMLVADELNAALLREVMRQSWWWSSESEGAFQDALAPRREALKRASPATQPAQVDAALTMYFEGLRQCFAEGKSPQDCKARVTNSVFKALKISTDLYKQ